ncbi:response regulator [Thermodesulfobacteriota bacterium]
MEDKILFVDDEGSVLKALTWLFADEPYQVLAFNSPLEALKEIENTDVAVVMADQRMPEMEGSVFLEKIKEMRPDTVRIIMTGYDDFQAAVNAINLGNVYRFVNKPWDEIELKLTIKNAVSRYRLTLDNRRLSELNEEQHEQLLEFSKDLERKIRDRTAELERVNEQLRAEIENRELSQEALKKSEIKYRTTQEANPDPVVVYDIDGLVIYFNPAFTRVFGWTLDERLGKKMDLFVPEENWTETRKMIEKVIAGESFSGVETQRLTREGKIIPVSLSGAIYHDRSGRPAGSIITLRDITDHKRLEAQLQQSQKMEAVGTLAGGVAHDFNNLLMGIQGRSSLMLMDIDSAHPHYGHLKGIEEYVRSASDLTKQLLGFARGGKYETKPTDMNDVIHRSSELFGRTKKEIMIHTKFQEGLWAVEADQGQIDQVLLNLYVNAWQAMPGGGNLYLQTENVTLEEDDVRPYHLIPGKYVEISVTDTGVGMDEATRERIFDPFFSTKEMGRGTGLGLATVYGIIKNHNGYINVYSTKGEGTTFVIHLPASEKTLEGSGKSSAEVAKGTETVLFVDDEKLILDVGEQLIGRMGYHVLTAASGQEALDILSEDLEKIDVVILDMIMPEMNGGETYHRIMEIKPEMKVLLSSGYSIEGQASEIMAQGCNGFIQKPFNMEDLSQKLREVLES